jgi:hypothetical protein
VAQKLLEILRLAQQLAETFLRADDVELLRELAIRGDQVVAEQIDLLADEPAPFWPSTLGARVLC